MTVVYQYDPASEVDDAFEPGRMEHLVPGNEGRLLDARRTPVRLNQVRAEVGMFEAEALAFEDQGARWEMPFEDVDRFQFRRGAKQAPPGLAATYRATAEKLGRRLQLAADLAARSRTELLIRVERERVKAWLSGRVDISALVRQSLLQPGSGGSAELQGALAEYLERAGLMAIDLAFARAYVSNPNAGEVVQGHEIALAGLGLVPYDGRALRDPASWSGLWSESRREEHIIARLAFVSSLFELAGLGHVTLYRGFSAELPRHDASRHSFISATFDRAVAMAHFEGNERSTIAALYRQKVPVRRLFMTYVETEPLNHPYREAEAILLRADGDSPF